MSDPVSELARLVVNAPPTPGVKDQHLSLSRGVVTDIGSAGICTINLDGDTTPVQAEMLSSYPVADGDAVEVLVVDTRLIILGAIDQGDTGWVDVSSSLLHGWTGTLAYRIRGNELRINGAVSGGANNTIIYTLPSAAWPVGDGGDIGCVTSAGTGYINVSGANGNITGFITSGGATIFIAAVSLLIN